MANHNRTSLPKQQHMGEYRTEHTNQNTSRECGNKHYLEYLKLKSSLTEVEWEALESMRRKVIEKAVDKVLMQWNLDWKLHAYGEIAFGFTCYLACYLMNDILVEKKNTCQISELAKKLTRNRRNTYFKKYARQLESCKALSLGENTRWGSVRRFSCNYDYTQHLDFIEDTSVAFGYGETPETVLMRQEEHRAVVPVLEKLGTLKGKHSATKVSMMQMQLSGEAVGKRHAVSLGIQNPDYVRKIKFKAIENLREFVAEERPWLDQAHYELYDTECKKKRKPEKSTFEQRAELYKRHDEPKPPIRTRRLTVIVGKGKAPQKNSISAGICDQQGVTAYYDAA